MLTNKNNTVENPETPQDTDPQGVDWEAFFIHGTATVYGEGMNARPAPEVMEKLTRNDEKEAQTEIVETVNAEAKS